MTIKVAHSIYARKPNTLYYKFWLIDENVGSDDVTTSVQVVNSNFKGKIELNNADLITDLSVNQNGLYDFSLKIHEQMFDILQSKLKLIRFVIGTYSKTVENPTIVYLESKDKDIDSYGTMKLKKQLLLWEDFVGWPVYSKG
jgi:hypothetical protein